MWHKKVLEYIRFLNHIFSIVSSIYYLYIYIFHALVLFIIIWFNSKESFKKRKNFNKMQVSKYKR